MRPSTTISNRIFIISFWIIVWQIGSVLTGSSILLASPVEVAGRLVALVQTAPFWFTIINSFVRIVVGFILGLGFGMILAVMSYNSTFFKELFAPLLSLIKSIPVASFIILLLVWVSSKNLSIVISFLVVTPIAFENIYNSLLTTNKEMLEMSIVFRVNIIKKIHYLYLSSLMPGLMAAVSIGLGFCFKSGVAAEVIGICKNTIGEAIYMSKINLETADVLAWTLVIVCISSITERIGRKLVFSIQKGYKTYDRTEKPV